MILTASILKIYVTWQGTNITLPDDYVEISKHVGVYITYRDTVVILCDIYWAFFGSNKNNNKNARYMH